MIKKREDLIVAAAAGIIRMQDYFIYHRNENMSDQVGTKHLIAS
jgi:hypothetical protein